MQAAERIYLTPLSEADLDFMLQLTSNRQVTKYLTGLICDKDSLLFWFNSLTARDREMIIHLTATGERIGECSMTISKDGRSAEIGYMLLPEYWNHGYGTATANILVEMAVSSGIEQVTAATSPDNIASIRILQKSGFVQRQSGWLLNDGSGDVGIQIAFFVRNCLEPKS